MRPSRETSELFGRGAASYAQFRPRYPRDLFVFLADAAPSRRRAWDCATGNGQAAVELAEMFDEVIATDASAEQIAHAEQRANVHYGVAAADTVDVEAASVDLVTVAQALHWLDLPAFYREVRRVAVPGGVIAAWSYYHVQIGGRVDVIVERLMHDTVGPYWPAGRELVEQRYETIAFPFDDIRAPSFVMRATWSLDELLGYIGTWSAVQRYRDAHHADPVALVRPELEGAWGRAENRREVRWPLYLRLGYVDTAAPNG